jgi:predicted ester cyclase
MMTTETNKMTVHRVFEEMINQGNRAVIDEVFAPDVVIHDPMMGTAVGADSFRQLMGLFDTAFPGHRVAVEQVLADGEFVSVLHTHTAVHNGPFMEIPPTGRQVKVNGLELFRLCNGKIVEFWRKDDDVSLLMQLGVMPGQ